MSSFNQNPRRKSEKSDPNEPDEETIDNEEEEANEEEADDLKEYETFDGSAELKHGKNRKSIQSESIETEMSKKSFSNRLRKNSKSNENLNDVENPNKSKKKNISSSQNENYDEDEDESYTIKRLVILLKDLKISMLQLENEYEPISFSAFIIEQFLESGQYSIDSILNYFSSFYGQYKDILQSFSLNSVFNELYEFIRNLEIKLISLTDEEENTSLIKEFINKIEKIKSPVSTLEPFDSLINSIRNLLEIVPSENSFYSILTKIYEKLVPIGLLFNSINLTNYIIHIIGQRSELFETLSLDVPEYSNIELQPYEPSILQSYHPNPYYVNHCLELVSILESEGIIMTSSEIIADSNSLVKIVAPNIQNELSTIHDCLLRIAEETGNESLKSLSDDISQKPPSIVQLFMLEKKLTTENVKNPNEDRQHVLDVLRLFRILHSLFLILDSEKLITYSNAVHLTYFRTFAAEIAHEDLLCNQSLLRTIEKEVFVKIALKTTQYVNPVVMEQRTQLMLFLFSSSIDVFNIGFRNPGDSANVYLKWFKFFTTIQAETDKKECIIEYLEKLPPLSDYKEKVLSFLTEDEFELPNVSSVVHLQLIFQAELSDTCYNFRQSRINQLKTTCYFKQYYQLLQSVIDDGFITVPDGFSMNDDIRSFNEHHWDLSLVDILPFLYKISEFLPPLSPSTADIHLNFAKLHSGYITYENVARFSEISLMHSTEFSDQESFISLIGKLSNYALFLDFHDRIVLAHALASDPPFSLLRNVNAQVLCRTIANQLLMLNTASVFEPSLSKNVAFECRLLRTIANTINPSLVVNPKIREKLLGCIHNINGFFDNPNFGIQGILNQVKISFALSRVENDELKPLMNEAVDSFNKIEPLIQMNQPIIDNYFHIRSVVDKIVEKFPSEAGHCDYIMNNIKLAAVVSQLKESLLTAEDGQHPFVCIFPVSMSDKMGGKVPTLSSIQPFLINRNHFPIPDKPLNISQQNRLVRLFENLQEERKQLVEKVSKLQQMSEERMRLQQTVDELFEERKSLIEKFNANRREMEKLSDQMSKPKPPTDDDEIDSQSIVEESGKVTPNEVMIKIEKNARFSQAIQGRISIIETQLSCFESSLKDSNDDFLGIEKEIFDIQIQKSFVKQKNRIAIEMKKAVKKEDGELIEKTNSQIEEPPSGVKCLDPALSAALPTWIQIPEKVISKIDKEITGLSKMTEETNFISQKFIQRKKGISSIDGGELQANFDEVESEPDNNVFAENGPEIDKLTAEIKTLKKKRDELIFFIQKSKRAIESILNGK